MISFCSPHIDYVVRENSKSFKKKEKQAESPIIIIIIITFKDKSRKDTLLQSVPTAVTMV